jgi:hypothetical protein
MTAIGRPGSFATALYQQIVATEYFKKSITAYPYTFRKQNVPQLIKKLTTTNLGMF